MPYHFMGTTQSFMQAHQSPGELFQLWRSGQGVTHTGGLLLDAGGKWARHLRCSLGEEFRVALLEAQKVRSPCPSPCNNLSLQAAAAPNACMRGLLGLTKQCLSVIGSLACIIMSRRCCPPIRTGLQESTP